MKKKEYDKMVLDVMNKKLTAQEKLELSWSIELYRQKLKKQGKKKGGFLNSVVDFFYRKFGVR
jgi:hypothetical protein